METLLPTIIAKLTDVGLKLLGALAIWLIGRYVIRLGVDLLGKSMRRGDMDATIILYAQSIASVLLNVALAIAIMGVFGVETTSFAAFIAGVSVAIGAAWAGLLANFAAGAFLVLLRPFRTGDNISAGGVSGVVTAIGMFITTVNTDENVQTHIGNAKIFSDNILNYTTNPHRRVDLTAPIAHTVEPLAVIEKLKAGIAKIPNVATSPAPEVHILKYASIGCILAVRPYTHNSNYWQVYFDANKAIREVLGDGGFPAPELKPEAVG